MSDVSEEQGVVPIMRLGMSSKDKAKGDDLDPEGPPKIQLHNEQDCIRSAQTVDGAGRLSSCS